MSLVSVPKHLNACVGRNGDPLAMPASIIANKSIVFHIKGNSYRLIVEIPYDKRCGLLLNATVTFFPDR